MVLVLAAFCVVVLHDGSRRPVSAEAFAWLRSPTSLPKLWQAPRFALIDQHGNRVTLESLHGRPFIADFIFTQCASACPLMTAKMVSLQHKLADTSVAFVSFSVDPAHDTPEVLARYAIRWNPMETRWSLLSTTPSALKSLTTGFRVTVVGNGDPADPIVHSTVFLLVDGEGSVRGVYDSEDPDALAALASAARGLSRGTGAPVAARPPGSLYASLGCGGCHDQAMVAPPLVNLRGARRTLEGDASVTIDDAYVRTAIVDPARDRVAGYTIAMPSYRDELTRADIDTLVAEILARTSNAGDTAPADAKTATDPVCGMTVRVEPETGYVDYQGKRYYFCSDACRESFSKAPQKFLTAPSR